MGVLAPALEVASDNSITVGTSGGFTTNMLGVSTINTYPSGTKIYNDYGSLSEYYVRVGENGNITAKSGATPLGVADGSTSQLDLNNDATLSLLANTVDGPSGLAISGAGYDTALTGYASLSLNCIGAVSGLDFNDIGSVDLYANGGDMNVYNNTAAAINISSLGAYTIASATTTGQISGLSTINGVAYPVAVKQATYYNSVAQNLTSGATDLTFDSTGAWNNADGYITHTSGTADFTVVQAGLYQLEFNATINANGATWTTTTNKTLAIDITRSPTAEQAIVAQASLIASGTNYSQGVSATYYLEAGDVINLRIQNTFATATATAVGITNTFDLGTFFTWRFIS